MHYRPGEFVKAPEGTKFFVFESLEYADEFVGKNIRLQIWKATAKGLDVPPRRIGDRPIQSTFSTSGGPTIAGNPTVYSPVIGSREAPCGLMSFGSTSASCLTVLSKCQPRCPRPCRRSSGCQQHPTTQMQSCNLGLFLSSRRLSDPLCKRNHLTLSADAIKSTSHNGLTIHGGDQDLLAQ